MRSMEVKQPAKERINDSIPIQEEYWEVVSVDFIIGLLVSEGYDAIFVVVDKLSKIPIYAPTYTTADSKDTAKLFFDAVVRHHGLPNVIISDRDPKFTANFRKSLMNIMGVKLSMTTAHRAQADGQTERQNLVLEDALRCLVAYSGENWVKLRGTVEYAHATSVNASSKLTPSEIDTGRKVSNLISHEYKEYDGLGPQPISEFASKFAKDRQDVVRKARKNQGNSPRKTEKVLRL
ncbi:unnamed protein product [Peronospora effusa]|nr:unnamed protein product [Peronospora effusa]